MSVMALDDGPSRYPGETDLGPYVAFDGLHSQPRPASRPSRTTERKREIIAQLGPMFALWAMREGPADAVRRITETVGKTAASALLSAWQRNLIAPVSTVRIAIDATCPACGFPEITGYRLIGRPIDYACTRCRRWHSAERPE